MVIGHIKSTSLAEQTLVIIVTVKLNTLVFEHIEPFVVSSIAFTLVSFNSA